MTGKILSFETPEKNFLRIIQELVKSLKQKEIAEKDRKIIFFQIYNLLEDYREKLPDYFDDITWHLENIMDNELGNFERNIMVEELLIYCELLSMPASPEVFYQMVKTNFSGVYDYPKMTEEILLKVIEDLKEEQKKEFNNLPKLKLSEDELDSIFSSSSFFRREYWAAIPNMRYATEKVLLEMVNNAELDIGNFYECAQNIAVAGNTTERVLLALLERIQQTCWKKGNQSYEILKDKLYYFILLEGKVTENVVKKILMLARPKGKEYYSFYYMILRNYGKNTEIREILRKILIRDEKNMGKKQQTSRNKIRLLLENGAHS